MNKVFIGLLIIAAGAGVYFFLLKKKDNPFNKPIHQEWITGKWKVDSLSFTKDSAKESIAFIFYLADSNTYKNVYQFYDKRQMIVSYPYDTLSSNDTSYFQFSKNNELLIQEKATDTTATVMLLLQPDSTHFTLKTEAGSSIYFKREK